MNIRAKSLLLLDVDGFSGTNTMANVVETRRRNSVMISSVHSIDNTVHIVAMSRSLRSLRS